MSETQLEIMHNAGFVTASEAASLIGAQHVGTIHRMVKKDTLAGERVGSHWYVQIASLIRSVDGSPTMKKRVLDFAKEQGIPHVAKKRKL